MDALVAAALAADADAVARVRSGHASALPDGVAAHPGPVVRAVAAGNLDAVRLLVALGFPIDGLGRADLPVDEPWETGPHHAAGNGDVPLVRVLPALGADPTVVDGRFGATSRGWAPHLDHAEIVDLLPTAQ